jgi:hypothetical protein
MEKPLVEEPVLEEIVIPAENAVFWLDKNGIWQNESGRFRKKRIIDLFNASLRKDEQGYYVTQINGNRREKVYFRYEDTALFAVDFELADGLIATLNNGEKKELYPKNLFIQNDCLYSEDGLERIKFSERCLIKAFKVIESEDDRDFLRINGTRHPIRNLDS